MKKHVLNFLYAAMALVLIGSTIYSCKKDKDDEETPTPATAKYALIIENGAQTISPDNSITYSAILIDVNGAITPATGVTWSTSDSQVATINSSGAITIAGSGYITVTASVTIDGYTYKASVPLGITMPSIFAVAPSAIIYEKGGSLQLETVYFSIDGTNPTYTFSSSNTSVATVSSSGLVSFIDAGECQITVTANLNGNPQVIVPVLVIGIPEVELPVTRVSIDPASADLFRNETQTLTAHAYKSNGDEVTGKTFVWTSTDPTVATVNASGVVTPVNPGSTYIHATTDGIIGQSEIIVNPDTMVVVDPYYVSIGQGGTKQFTATAYRVTRTNVTPLTGINFNWEIPTYGFSMFDIATVNSTGLVTLKQDAMAGMMTFVVAYDQNNINSAGAATIMVAIADECDCGAGNPDVASINVANGNTINMTVMGGPVQLNVTAYDSFSSEVTNPDLVFCSDNISVVSVDSNGELVAAGEGTATIKICSGSYAETTVTVNVTFF